MQRVAQTSLREMIGSSVLSTLLSERKEADATLKAVIGAKTAEWGVTAGNRRARYYKLTAAGRKRLHAELEQYRRVNGAIQKVLQRA